jgi:hypothetical protein
MMLNSVSRALASVGRVPLPSRVLICARALRRSGFSFENQFNRNRLRKTSTPLKVWGQVIINSWTL